MKKAYRVRNWCEYEAGLRNRGSLTVWVSLIRAGLRGKRLRLSDDGRRTLAVKAQALGREALAPIASAATSATLLRRCLTLGSRGQRLVAFAVTLSALLSGIAAPRIHAQTTWGVEVSPSTLTIDEGESLTYRLRLTEPPLADGWWVVLRVNGSIRDAGHYRGISWVPSAGWEFNRDNWDTWREVRVTALQDEDGLDGSVTFTHDVWDENADCPVKGESPVTVRVIDDDRGDSLPTLSIADAAVAEGGTAEFVVTLTPASTETVTVRYQTKNGTALAGSDYTETSETLTFTAGQTTKTILVATVDDDAQESVRTLHGDPAQPGRGHAGRSHRGGDDQGQRRRWRQNSRAVHRGRGGGRRGHGQVQGDVEHRERRAGDGGLPHGRRDGGCRLGLHDEPFLPHFVC